MKMPTPSELLVTNYMLKGWSNSKIAKAMGITVKGVKWHITNILAAHECKSRYELMAKILGEKVTESEMRTFMKVYKEVMENGGGLDK